MESATGGKSMDTDTKEKRANEKQARKRKNPDLTGFEDDGDE